MIFILILEQAGPEEEEQEGIVELENLMRAMSNDELAVDSGVKQDSEVDPEDPEEGKSGPQ